MTAGVSVIRTSTASTSTPTARANPIGRTMTRCENAKPRNTEVMMIAAAVTTLAPWTKPVRTAVRESCPCDLASCMPETRNIW